ncbi:MAG TPA: hypothetical protein VNM90_19520 [Haliangium sp.]|nr:hypothetical protein [Haliangium sp.]
MNPLYQSAPELASLSGRVAEGLRAVARPLHRRARPSGAGVPSRRGSAQ